MRRVVASHTWPYQSSGHHASESEDASTGQRVPLSEPQRYHGKSSALETGSNDTYIEAATIVPSAAIRQGSLNARDSTRGVSEEHDRPPSIHNQTMRQGDDFHSQPIQSQESLQEDHSTTHMDAGEGLDPDEHEDKIATFEAIEPPPGYPALDFRPTMLKPQVTIIVCICYIGLAAGVSLLAVLPDARVAYSIKSDTYYFAIRYGPGVIAAVSSFLFKNTAQEVLRMLPYINMADPKGPYNARCTVLARYWPLLHDRHTPGTWTNFVLLTFSGNLIAYKAVLLEVVRKGTEWEVYIHTAIAIPLIAYYATMALYMLILTVWMWNKSTGIRSDYDPHCLADVVGLFAHFNENLDDEGSIDGAHMPPTIPKSCSELAYRLGYWRVKSGRGIYAYGIRSSPACNALGKATQTFLNQQSKIEARVAKRSMKLGHIPYLFSLWAGFWYWMSIAFLLGWISLLTLLFANGYIKHNFALLNDWSLHRIDRLANGALSSAAPNITLVPSGSGFFIDGDNGSPHKEHLIAANFLLRFLPLWSISCVANQMVVQDTYHRFMQPIYNMARKATPATDSLLLDYLTKSPFAVTSDAFQKSQWKVFTYSLLGSAPDFLMLLPYGILTLTSVGTTIVCQFSITSVSGTSVLLILWLVTLLSSWPSQRRCIPRPNMSLLDIWSLCHKSRIASDPCFARSEPHWTKQHFHGELVLRSHKYSLGWCRGEDGKTRTGFDIHGFGAQSTLTSWVDRIHPRHLRIWKNKPGTRPDQEADGHEMALLGEHDPGNADGEGQVIMSGALRP